MSKPKVLVIEDNEDTNDLMCSILRSAGYHVEAAFDGVEGFESAKELLPDLILLDIMMPRMDGIKVCHSLKQNADTENIPVIMVTAKMDLSTKITSFVSGARRFITKPFDIDDFIEETELALRQNGTRDAGRSTGEWTV